MEWEVLGWSRRFPGQPESKHCLLLALKALASIKSFYSGPAVCKPWAEALNMEMVFFKGSTVEEEDG